MRSSIRSITLSALTGGALLSSGGEARALDLVGARVDPRGALSIELRDEGLPEGRTIRYTLSSTMTAAFVCVPRDGSPIVPDPRVTIQRHILVVQHLRASHAGDAEGTITSAAPKIPPLDCPSSTEPRLESVHYGPIQIVSRYGRAVVREVSFGTTSVP